jgi:hypothetical protein
VSVTGETFKAIRGKFSAAGDYARNKSQTATKTAGNTVTFLDRTQIQTTATQRQAEHSDKRNKTARKFLGK